MSEERVEDGRERDDGEGVEAGRAQRHWCCEAVASFNVNAWTLGRSTFGRGNLLLWLSSVVGILLFTCCVVCSCFVGDEDV